MPKISIIVPVYNAEKYLPKCIDSVLAQTFTDWELLLIDDGSPDRSGEICDEYASKDTRIRVFHKSNGGVSSARNFGLDNATGEYITFLDSDDWLEDNCLELCWYNIETLQLDMLQFMHTQTVRYAINEGLYGKVLSAADYSKYYHPVCIGGLAVKRSIVELYSIRFIRRVKYGEDQLFVFECLEHSHSILYLDAVLYNYRVNSDSATHCFNTKVIVDSISELTKYKERHPETKMILDGVVLDLVLHKCLFKDKSSTEIKKIVNDLHLGNNIIVSWHFPKMFARLAQLNTRLAVYLGKLYFSIIR